METKVVDSRPIEEGKSIRRRRECEYCKTRFTTFERVGITELLVVKWNWTKEVYDKTKVERALMLAFAKRQISSEVLDEIMSELEINWSGIWKEIDSRKIWEDILEILKKYDLVAYIRFASVYKKFE